MNELPDHLECEVCEESIRHFQKLVATAEGVDRARALIELGDAAHIAFRLDLALASFGACRDLLPSDDFADLQCQAIFKESCVLAEQGLFAMAIERLSEAKAICTRQGDLEHLSLCEWKQGVFCASLGRETEAIELISAARDRYLELQRPGMAALVELDLNPATW